MDLSYLTKRTIGKIYMLFKGISGRLRLWAMVTNPNVQLGQSCRIDPTAKIETKYGGSISIGENTEILEGVLIQTYGGKITIGANCSINPYTIIYGHGNTTIGENVLIAGGCMIIPSNHSFSNPTISIREQPSVSKGITIERNVWIGHGSSVLDGVTIGQGSVVAAGSVVNKTIPAHSVVAGVPAQVIKKRI
ncbi:MAG: hypothetical protein JNM57_10380 [Cyclobacteriaceae bacterium]|nr:hypothetical protein [Cyclobacteriaceae bacterium]